MTKPIIGLGLPESAKAAASAFLVLGGMAIFGAAVWSAGRKWAAWRRHRPIVRVIVQYIRDFRKWSSSAFREKSTETGAAVKDLVEKARGYISEKWNETEAAAFEKATDDALWKHEGPVGYPYLAAGHFQRWLERFLGRLESGDLPWPDEG